MDRRQRSILIVEDDDDIATTLKYNLAKEGEYHVTVARTGESGLALAKRKEFDLVILDLMLPGMDGFEVCRELRATSLSHQAPVLMLTARGEETDKLVGLRIGADDYITKPFSMREVLARVKAHLRRSSREPRPHGAAYRGHGLEIDFDGHRVLLDGKEITLTRMEFALLSALVQNPDRVLTRDRLLETVWGYDHYVGSRTVDVHVRRLRRKLGRCAERIETVVGVGYRFRAGTSPTAGA